MCLLPANSCRSTRQCSHGPGGAASQASCPPGVLGSLNATWGCSLYDPWEATLATLTRLGGQDEEERLCPSSSHQWSVTVKPQHKVCASCKEKRKSVLEGSRPQLQAHQRHTPAAIFRRLNNIFRPLFLVLLPVLSFSLWVILNL
jgi:hypothetical protein